MVRHTDHSGISICAYLDLCVKTDTVLLCCCRQMCWKFPKSLHGEVQARPSPLLHSTWSELGCTAEKDRCRAGTLDRPGHALVYEKRHAGWDLDGGQAVCEVQQPAGL